MKTRTKRLLVVAGLAISLLAVPIAVQSETKQDTQSEKLDELLKQRQATLRQLVKVVTAEYRLGRIGYESVVRATDQLIDAELELAQNQEERTAILQRRIGVMQNLVAMAEARFRAGQATQADVLAAQAAVLEAKIQLTRQQIKDDESGQ